MYTHFAPNAFSKAPHESGEHNEYTAFAEDMISAMKDGSVQRLASCLKAFHEMIEEEDKEQDQME